MKYLGSAACIAMSVVCTLLTITTKTVANQANVDWLSLLSQPTTQQQAPQGLLSYLLDSNTSSNTQSNASFLNSLATLFNPKTEAQTTTAQPTVWDVLVKAWKESTTPVATTAQPTTQQESPIVTALANLFKPGTPSTASDDQHKQLTEQEKRVAFKKSQEMSVNFLKQLGLPVPEYTPEQEEQLFQQSNALYEKLNSLINNSAETQ